MAPRVLLMEVIMSQYTEAEFVQSFPYREVRVDIYTCRKGAPCCGIQQEVEDQFCVCCGTPLIHRPIFQVCIAGMFIPGADCPDEDSAVELAKYVLDEHPDVIFDPRDYLLMRMDVYASDDEDTWGEDDEDETAGENDPAPGSAGDRFNRLLSDEPSRKGRDGRSDLLDPVLPDDVLTEAIIEAGLEARALDIVPCEPPEPDDRPSLQGAATLASLAKQIKQLGWVATALEIVKEARTKTK